MEIDDGMEEVDVVNVMIGENKVGTAGICRESGTVYLGGDLHPLGSFAAIMKAYKEDIPYISTGAVNAMFPSDWLRGECLADPERLRVIGNLEKFLRTGSM